MVTLNFTKGRKISRSAAQTPQSARISVWIKSGGNKSHISVGRYIWNQFQHEEVLLSVTGTHCTQRASLFWFPVGCLIINVKVHCERVLIPMIPAVWLPPSPHFFGGQGHSPVALFFKVVPYPCISCADICPRSWYIIYGKQVEPEMFSVMLNDDCFANSSVLADLCALRPAFVGSLLAVIRTYHEDTLHRNRLNHGRPDRRTPMTGEHAECVL